MCNFARFDSAGTLIIPWAKSTPRYHFPRILKIGHINTGFCYYCGCTTLGYTGYCQDILYLSWEILITQSIHFGLAFASMLFEHFKFIQILPDAIYVCIVYNTGKSGYYGFSSIFIDCSSMNFLQQFLGINNPFKNKSCNFDECFSVDIRHVVADTYIASLKARIQLV